MIKRAFMTAVAVLVVSTAWAQGPFANPDQYALRTASGALSAGETTTAVTGLSGFDSCQVVLDVTTITTADADDEVDFYVQTTYDGGTTWTDVENVHFDNDDDGTTATRVVVIDGAKDGPGRNKVFVGSNPGTGADSSESVPANEIWRVQSYRIDFTTDGTGTPTPEMQLDDGTNSAYYVIDASAAQSTGATAAYVAGPVERNSDADNTVHMPTPELLMTGGHRIIFADNGDANDDSAAPVIWLEAWHDARVTTDGTMGDDLKSYDRPVGSQLRIKTAVTGATAPTYAYSATATCK